MPASPFRIAYLTAGAGGMYCGSCMHDNTLARALIQRGVDVQLIPLYTPIRTDEDDVSVDRVFFGGINVYLQQQIPLFRHFPAFVDRWLDAPWLLRLATSQAIETSPRELGALTVSMLRGRHGFQHKEVRRLCSWLSGSVKPNLVDFSNVLIAGCAPAIREALDVPLLVTLQGDDVFLEELAEPFKSQAFHEIRRLVPSIDGFIVNSRYYADFMVGYLSIPPSKIHVVPLGIDTSEFQRFAAGTGSMRDGQPPTVGYLARLAPEKGLHVLVDAFIELRQRRGMEDSQLRIAGWLGEKHRNYVRAQFDKLRAVGLADAYSYAGAVDRAGKIKFLSQLDVLTVPSVYRDPKGLYVLEALAAGVPVIQPAHGAFPELLEALGGGHLVRPNDPQHLADALHQLLLDREVRHELGRHGRQAVHRLRGTDLMASAMQELYRQFISP